MQRLGMSDAFQMGVADYSRMFVAAPEVDLYISRAFHQAVIEFSEEGTEAAAATAVVMSVRGGRPQEPEVMRFDRPFEFMIRHRETGAVLFVGRVEDPTA
jgi:serpin B